MGYRLVKCPPTSLCRHWRLSRALNLLYKRAELPEVIRMFPYRLTRVEGLNKRSFEVLLYALEVPINRFRVAGILRPVRTTDKL